MDDFIYHTLRSVALRVLKPHVDALLAQHHPPDGNQIAGRKTTFLRRPREQAIALWRLRLKPEKERSAVRLLAVVVKHHALLLGRDSPRPNSPHQKIDNKSLPLQRLDRIQLQSLENRTLAAVKQLARHFPKPEADYLVGCVTGTGFEVAVAAVKEERKVAEQAPESEAMRSIGWYDTTMDAALWFAMKAVDPEKAAMLLCRYNPNTEALATAEQSTNDKTGPRQLFELRQRFEDISRVDPCHRALVDWLRIARDMGLRYHPWIDEYIGVAGIPLAEPEPLPTTQAEPASASAPAESPKDRRTRLLSWLEEEETARGKQGAVQRVFTREKQRRPTADRSNVSKDIAKARKERTQQIRVGAMYGQLKK